VKVPIATSQQSKSETEDAKSFVEKRNRHPFEKSHEHHNNDESAMFEYDISLLHGSRV
jgi:hypothetical protein